MTTRTYELDPTSLTEAFAIIGQNGPNLFNLNAAQRSDDDTTISTIAAVGFGLNLSQVSFMRFDFGSTVAKPPAGSVVTDARLRLTSALTSAQPFEVAVAVLASGLWSDPTLPNALEHFGPGSTQGNDAQVTVRDPSSVVIEGPTIPGTSGFFEWPFKTNVIDGCQRIGQTVLVNSNDTLGECAVRLKRTISRVGATVWVRVFQARANDGSDDRPDEVLGALATSDTRPHDDISAGTNGSELTFTFSGGDQIALSSGTRYVFVVESSWSGSGPLQATRVLTKSGNQYADGSLQLGSLFREAFAEANYPEYGQLPFLYEADNSTPRVAPHGSIVEMDMPAMTNNVVAELTGLEEVVQEWLDTGTEDVIGFTVHPVNIGATTAGSRQWDDAELVVTFGTPVDMSASVAVPWSASLGAAIIVKVVSAVAAVAWSATGLSQVVKLASAAATVAWSASGAANLVKLISAAASVAWSALGTIAVRVVGVARGLARAIAAVAGRARALPAVGGDAKAEPAVRGEARAGDRGDDVR